MTSICTSHQVEAFVADVVGKGGTAVVGSLRLDERLQEMLRRAGVDPRRIK